MGENVSLDNLGKKFSQINVNDPLERAIKLCCEKVRSDIQESMSNTPRDSSKSYYTNNKKIAHHPSLPYNPPAPDTGNLRESIRYEVNNNKKEVYGIVGTTQKDPPYGAYLEYGTSRGPLPGIIPRPWLRPAMIKNNDFIRRTITSAVEKAVKGGGK